MLGKAKIMSPDKLSPVLENYIEIIADLIEERKVARVRDIAGRNKVSMASVNGALKRLTEKGFIKHNPYEFIELTEAGWQLRRNLDAKHGIIRRLFQEILHINPKVADQDACTIEHHLSPETLHGMVEFFKKWDLGKTPGAPDPKPVVASEPSHAWKSLQDTPLLKKVKIKKVHAPVAMKHRLMEMGVIPGEMIHIKRVAPLGDPLEVELKGYGLSLRKNEAQTIEVTDV